MKESDFQRRPDGGYDNIVEPQPENQPRRRTGMDPENDDSFALFPEDDDSDDMEMLNLIQSGMPEQVAKDYINIYEVLLVQGASKGVAKQKVTELFSPPRVTEEMRRVPNLMFEGGETYDLFQDKNGKAWDFRKAADRKQVRAEIMEQKPWMVIGSPPCTAFSSLMSFNKNRMDNNKFNKQISEGKLLLNFAVDIYKLQASQGRHFLHEHPAGASSWSERCVKRLLKNARVHSTVGHLCRYGMKAKDRDGKYQPVRKATRFASTSEEVLRQLSSRCRNDHVHLHRLDGRAKSAARYPPELCRAIISGNGKRESIEQEQDQETKNEDSRAQAGTGRNRQEQARQWDQEK